MTFMDLFRPKWKHSNFKVRCAAIEQISDQTMLINIARNDKDENVRKAAVNKINDQAVLAEITRSDTPFVGHAAFERIHNQVILNEIAVNAKIKGYVREWAIETINDQTLLSRIAATDSDSSIRCMAVSKIEEEVVLLEIVKSDTDEKVREEAIKKVSDEAFLLETIKTDKSKAVRSAAVRRIDNADLLRKIAGDAKDIDMRATALATAIACKRKDPECTGEDYNKFVQSLIDRIFPIRDPWNETLIMTVIDELKRIEYFPTYLNNENPVVKMIINRLLRNKRSELNFLGKLFNRIGGMKLMSYVYFNIILESTHLSKDFSDWDGIDGWYISDVKDGKKMILDFISKWSDPTS
jgi:hypothetical protein